MKKMLTDIDAALNRDDEAFKPSGPPVKNVDNTFGIYRRKDGQLEMGSKVVKTGEDGKILTSDDTEYELTPGLHASIVQRIPRPMQYNADDYQEYISLVKQTKVKSFPHKVKGGIKPYDRRKWRNMLKEIWGEKVEVEPVSVIDFNNPHIDHYYCITCISPITWF